MPKLWDFVCPSCGRFESWGEGGDIDCPGCGTKARRQIGSRGVLLSFKDDGFPRASRMWADYHERATRKEYEQDG